MDSKYLVTDTRRVLQRQLAHLIREGKPFTADDLTLDGRVAIDSGHNPNSSQNAIGSIFSQSNREGLIVFTGNTRKSKAPHRKGGLIREWRGTLIGLQWADELLEQGELFE